MTTTAPTRTLSRALAEIVTDLELAAPILVDLADLAALAARHGIRTRARELASRLRERGWLLATSRPGVYEFAPGAHAGPYGHGDPFIDLRAELRAHPGRPATLALGSALWLHGLAERAPNRHEVAVAPGSAVSAGLARVYRVVHFQAQTQPSILRGLPVHSPATILVHLAARPTQVRSWSPVLDVLPDLLERADVPDLIRELAGRPDSVSARLGYLLSGLLSETESHKLGLHPTGSVVWFGPRATVRRTDRFWGVVDTVLPARPSQVGRPEPGADR
jgi:predicted transcriptional regulator of viral defense system